MTIVGCTSFLAPRDEKRSAFGRLAQHARDGEVTVELEQVSLDHIAEAWARLQAGASRKLVVIPETSRRASASRQHGPAGPRRSCPGS